MCAVAWVHWNQNGNERFTNSEIEEAFFFAAKERERFQPLKPRSETEVKGRIFLRKGIRFHNGALGELSFATFCGKNHLCYYFVTVNL